jgi:hypothetical protein
VVRTGENAERGDQASQSMALYDKFSTSARPVDQIFDGAAKRLASGENPNVVKQTAYGQIRAHLAQQIQRLTGAAREGLRTHGGNEAGAGQPDQLDARGTRGNDARRAGALRTGEVAPPGVSRLSRRR